MENAEIALVFETIANILDIKGENAFRVRSYHKAARVVGDMPESLAAMVAAEKDLVALDGIGKSTAEKIREMVATGKCSALEKLQAGIPTGLLDLLHIEGVGPKKVKLFYEKLDVKNVDELRAAAEAGKLRELPGMGEKAEQKILKGVAFYGAGIDRFPISTGLAYAEAITRHLSEAEGVARLVPAGSLRRGRETVGDLDILAICEDRKAVMDRFVACPETAEILAHGDTKSSIRLACGLQVDIRALDAKSFGAALHYFTGSKEHNIAMRDRAREMGLKISEYGVFAVDGNKRIGGATEEEIFAGVGLPFIPPELREGRGEIEAALAGDLPDLVELEDIRGDLHMHSTASDGRSDLPALAAKAKSLGYRYIAVTDHSKAVRVANGLDERRLAEHFRTIDALDRETKGLAILKGAEVDILADGTLDYPDEVLATCDVVIASIHSGFGMAEEAMTRRILRALENPHVTILGHPTGRLVLGREPYKVDLQAVVRAAVKHGVALEINGHPERLDLRDTDARMARDLGARIAIDTDSHAADSLDLMRFGVLTARRGWITKDDVLNCLSLRGLRAALKRT